jgi:hypothetical protein
MLGTLPRYVVAVTREQFSIGTSVELRQITGRLRARSSENSSTSAGGPYLASTTDRTCSRIPDRFTSAHRSL